jgi:carboxyl-terminal processing protease
MRNIRFQCLHLGAFLIITVLILSNGFMKPLFAQGNDTDIVTEIAPIGNVLDEILRNYVETPATDEVVEGALVGMMNSLDEHSSYIKPDLYREIHDETEGQFSGIGVQIQLDENKNIQVFHPIPDSPAAKEGMRGGDIIVEIDDVSTDGMSLSDAAKRIRGPKGTTVHITVVREVDDEYTSIEFDIKRGMIPLVSIHEMRMIGDIGYVRVTDFKQDTEQELADAIKEFEGQGMKSFILDLRMNPGGLLSASREVAELFLPRGSLVTYTKGRDPINGELREEMTLVTERDPIIPETMPMIILVNENTASSSEIVTGALQFHKRAIVVGAKTYGKGSVQTIIPLEHPRGAALRLTTALYYTPARITIHKHGIGPDVPVEMDWLPLWEQLISSYRDNPDMKNQQNHGTVTGDDKTDETVEDIQLQKAVEILREDTVWDNLLQKYHKDTSETQVAAADGEVVNGDAH